MELIELKDAEFDKFAINHEYGSFLQNSFWGKIKEVNGWNHVILGVKDKKKNIKAATLLLNKKIPLGEMYYAPRGYLLDYSDLDLFEEFDGLITKYVKEHKGMFLKIDPYVMLKQKDKDNNVVEGGIDNTKLVEKLESLGYKKQNGKPGEQSLQATWMYWIRLKDRTLEDIEKDMTSKTRQMIRKNEKRGVVMRIGDESDLEEFQKIEDHTGDRRGFISRPLSYIKKMYEEFGNGKYIKVVFADLHIKDRLEENKKEYERLDKEYKALMRDIEAGKKHIGENKLKLKTDELERLQKDINEFTELKEKYGDVKPIGAIIYLVYGNEVLSFIGGAYDEFFEFQPFYTVHYEMIKYALENNYSYYNFYGISSNLSPDDPLYGIYTFKKGFGGEVVELVGEYDKVLSGKYYLYNTAYNIVHSLKKIKAKMHAKK